MILKVGWKGWYIFLQFRLWDLGLIVDRIFIVVWFWPPNGQKAGWNELLFQMSWVWFCTKSFLGLSSTQFWRLWLDGLYFPDMGPNSEGPYLREAPRQNKSSNVVFRLYVPPSLNKYYNNNGHWCFSMFTFDNNLFKAVLVTKNLVFIVPSSFPCIWLPFVIPWRGSSRF